ncbi:unnamed protein product [Heterobilharzia americana]|nr:unnamed protein product [Heterobilharzia americana]
MPYLLISFAIWAALVGPHMVRTFHIPIFTFAFIEGEKTHRPTGLPKAFTSRRHFVSYSSSLLSMSKIRTTLSVLSLGFGVFTAEALYSGNERFYRDWVMPVARLVVSDGETAHKLSVYAASHGFIPHKPRNAFPNLKCKVFGLEFDHPVGLAAGFDKNGEAFMGLLDAGFSYVEVGTVTPNPQPGNQRPRIFRWTDREAVINRCGFNSDGHDAVYKRLKDRPWEGRGVVGVNLGCNKTSVNPIFDYVAGVQKFGEIADYLVINISSPNTPGLRSLQTKAKLHDLLSKVS